MKRRLISIITLLCFSFSSIVLADNIGRNVYSLFSENFNGVNLDGYSWAAEGSVDNTQMFTWTGGNNSIRVTTELYDSVLNSKDGNKYWNIRSSGMSGWSGMSITFTSSYNVDTRRNMSDYANGTMSFWARSSNTAAQNYRVGVTDSAGDKTVTLSSLGFTSNGTWQKLSLQISSLGANMSSVKNIFLLLTNNINATLDIDNILLQKTDAVGTFDAALKDIATDNPALEISWDEDAVGKRWQAAKQYLELDLDIYPADTWGIQVYTTNTSSAADPVFTGTMTADMGSGLIESGNTTIMLPMCWRITDKVLPYSGANTGDDYDKTLRIGYNEGGLFDQGSFDAGDTNANTYYCWFVMKDEAMFSLGNPDVYNSADYLRAWDRRGFHSAAGDVNYWGMSPGTMHDNMIKPRIYFGADFGNAVTPMEYKTNSVVIELFYE